MTWALDGRATLSWGDEIVPGHRHVIWRRCGGHEILPRSCDGARSPLGGHSRQSLPQPQSVTETPQNPQTPMRRDLIAAGRHPHIASAATVHLGDAPFCGSDTCPPDAGRRDSGCARRWGLLPVAGLEAADPLDGPGLLPVAGLEAADPLDGPGLHRPGPCQSRDSRRRMRSTVRGYCQSRDSRRRIRSTVRGYCQSRDSRRRMRSTVGGWVENILPKPPLPPPPRAWALSGSMM